MAGAAVSLAEVVRAGISSALDEVHTSMPARVTAYDPVTNTIVAEPVLRQSVYSVNDGARTWEALPEIPFVPVLWPRAGGYVMRFPIDVGDYVLLVFQEGSLAEWKRSGGVVQPKDARRFSVGWPVAIPGVYPTTDVLSPLDAAAVSAGQAIFGEDGGKQVRVGSTGVELAPAGVTPVSPIALAVPTDAALTGLVAAMNAMQVTLAAVVSALNAHIHPAPGGVTSAPTVGTGGIPVSAPPPAASAPATTASLLVRAL